MPPTVPDMLKMFETIEYLFLMIVKHCLQWLSHSFVEYYELNMSEKWLTVVQQTDDSTITAYYVVGDLLIV